MVCEGGTSNAPPRLGTSTWGASADFDEKLGVPSHNSLEPSLLSPTPELPEAAANKGEVNGMVGRGCTSTPPPSKPPPSKPPPRLGTTR